jgi:hypothetical protein
MQQLKVAGEERLRLAARLRAEHAAAAQAEREASRARTKARWDDKKATDLAKLMSRHNRGDRVVRMKSIRLVMSWGSICFRSEKAGKRVQ